MKERIEPGNEVPRLDKDWMELSVAASTAGTVVDDSLQTRWIRGAECCDADKDASGVRMT